MKPLLFTLFLSVTLLIYSCDDCAEIDCFTPPAPFLFELIDASSGENVISNGPIKSRNLFLDDRISGRSLEYSIREENGRTIIFTNDIGWESGQIDIFFSAGTITNNSLFRFSVSSQTVSEDCCSFTRYNEINLSGANYEVEENTGIYIVEVVL